MNGFIPNSLNHNNIGDGAGGVAAVGQIMPQQAPGPPIILMNGAIPNQQNPPHPVVHYVHHPNHHHPHPQQQQHVQPQLMIPNGNVIHLAPSPQPSLQQQQNQIYVQRQSHQQPPSQLMMINGCLPNAAITPEQLQQQHHHQQNIQLAPRAPQQQQQRLIRLTPNGTYATTVQIAGNGTVTTIRPHPHQQQNQYPHPMTATLMFTKQPPPKCILCCLSLCGLDALWFQSNFHFSRVIALICNILVDLLMILCLLSTNWLTTIKYRQGLWQYCIDVDSPRPLPFGLDDHDGCHWGRNAAYIKLSGFFAVACFLLAIMATILTSFGLSSRDPNKKYTFYRFALYINLGALLAIIVSLTLYPAFFYSELHHTNMVPANRPHWYFGWAYGVGWGAAIFLVGSILLLVCDKETEEIYYQERTIVHAGNGIAGGGSGGGGVSANNNHILQHQQQQHQQHNQLINNSHQSIKA